MPYYKRDTSGVYIINKLSFSSNEIQIRKVKLTLAILKEEDNFNLSCWRFDENNNFIRAVDENNDNYNILDREMCLSFDVSLLREQMNTSQGNQSFWITVFPLHLNIARYILNDEKWIPLVKNNGWVRGEPSITDFNPNDPGNTKLMLNLSYIRLNEENTQTGYGSGIGITKINAINEKVYEAKPPVFNTDGNSLTIKSQTIEINYVELDIDPVPLETYMVFQARMIGNDPNIVVVTNDENGELMLYPNMRVLFDQKET
jgi:hypothetical protein